MLQKATKDAIAALLVQRDADGYTRGLFSEADLAQIFVGLDELSEWLRDHKPERIALADANHGPGERFSHQDVLCIAYVDHVEGGEGGAAQRLQRFFNRHLVGAYSHLHVLPHFPSPVIHPDREGPARRADGGFEAKSYVMDPVYGEPSDLERIDATLMFDFVLNHLSTSGEWFQRFLEDDPEFRDFFVTVPDPALDISQVFRPRAHHPVIAFENQRGETKHVWCTFSPGQADLNLKNPKVFLEVMRALLRDFVGAGAAWIRLDAVGYAIKMLGVSPGEPRTDCFGLPETHALVKAMNRLLADLVPSATLVAEVNATKDVIATYYGDSDEAHVAYEFPIAPLSLFSVYLEDCRALTEWSRERLAHPDRIGLAFTASHDGIGVLSMRDVPPLDDGCPALDFLVGEVVRRGGAINFKTKVIDGEKVQVPYEACITWAQAVLSPQERDALEADALTPEQVSEAARRFLASQSFMLIAPHCVPADYLGALTGLLNDEESAKATAHHRNKNRGLVDAPSFERAIEAPVTAHEHFICEIFTGKRRLLETRRAHSAFSPHARCDVGLVDAREVYSVLRQHRGETVLALTHASEVARRVWISQDRAPGSRLRSLFDDRVYSATDGGWSIELEPWQIAWFEVR